MRPRITPVGPPEVNSAQKEVYTEDKAPVTVAITPATKVVKAVPIAVVAESVLKASIIILKGEPLPLAWYITWLFT